MYKPRLKAPPVLNVVAGGNATLTLDPGPRYHSVILIATVVKIAPTLGFTSASLSDALGLINNKVNTVTKRAHTAQELNEVQSALSPYLAAVKYDGLDNTFNSTTAADTAGSQTYNSIACTQRTTTYVLFVNFAEPSRDTYSARAAFAWPTSWVNSSGKLVATANVQLEIGIPANSTVAGTSSMTSGGQLLINPAVRAEIVTDLVTGPFASDGVTPIMPITHWYRQFETYTGTTVQIRKFPFVGNLSQMSVFSPNGSGDDCTTVQIQKNNAFVFNSSKKINDDTNLQYEWNYNHLGTSSGDLAGTNWPAADVTHVAQDFDDDPTSWLPIGASDILELDIILAQATASNKSLLILSQVWRDALAS